MRWTQSLIPTQKENPADAQIISHQLMIRAGLIRQLTAGAYDFLPLGLRSLQKAAQIVREEMDAIGCAEVLLPALQPLELWQKTGRDVELRRKPDEVQGPPRPPDRAGADARRSGHRTGDGVRQQLQAAAAEPLPDSDQVPRRISARDSGCCACASF